MSGFENFKTGRLCISKDVARKTKIFQFLVNCNNEKMIDKLQLNSIDGDHHNGKQSCRNISRANLQFLYPENMNVYETNNTVKNKIIKGLQ